MRARVVEAFGILLQILEQRDTLYFSERSLDRRICSEIRRAHEHW
jgi:hypothetical protein